MQLKSVSLISRLCRQVLFEGGTTSAGEERINGDMQTLMSVSCPVPSKRKFTSRISLKMGPVFVRTFNVSVSTDGETFSESFEFYEYNSTFQELEQTADGRPRFTLKVKCAVGG